MVSVKPFSEVLESSNTKGDLDLRFRIYGVSNLMIQIPISVADTKKGLPRFNRGFLFVC